MPSTRILPVAAVLVAVPAFAALAAAQCTTQWSDTDPLARIRGTVNATSVFDPDGAGPLPAQLVAGGAFQVGREEHACVAAHDGQDWTVLDASSGVANAFTQWNGQLIAAGNTSPNAVRAWNGTTWISLGFVGGTVHAMTVYNGELIVAGSLTAVGGVPVNGIARWNGTTWSALGSGVQGTVTSLAAFNGALYVGGALTSAGGTAVSHLAIWGGSSWAAGPVFDAPIQTMAVRIGTAVTNSFLWVGGSFGNVGAVVASRVVRFSPSSGLWTAVPGLPGTNCRSLFVRGTGLNSFELSAAVDNSGSTQRVYRLLTGVWTALGDVVDAAPTASPRSLAYFGGRYVLGQAQADIGVQTFDGTAWAPILGDGVPARVRAVTSLAGDVVIGGDFARIDGVVMNGLARRVGGTWTPIGGGLGTGADVRTVVREGAAGLLVGGAFTTAGGTPVGNLARWNGTAWSNLGSGIVGGVYALLAMPNGDVIAGGDFLTAGGVPAQRVARWNGSSWSAMGSLNGTVRALALLPNGEVVAGGEFTANGGSTVLRLARWTGTAWAQLGAGCNDVVFALAVAIDGSLYAGGRFTAVGAQSASRMARWNGTTLTGLSLLGLNQDVLALAAHPSGTLLIGGGAFSFSLGPLGGWQANMLRLNGASVSPLDVDGTTIDGLAIVDGDVVAVGMFDSTNDQISANVARLHAGCPATGIAVPNQCVAAAPQLATASAPWLGTNYQAFAGPFSPTSLALEVYGFAGIALPLPPILSEAEAGCTLFATPDVSAGLVPVGGFVTTGFVVPLDPGLIGTVLHQQMLELQFGPGGAIAAVRTSNGLVLTLGTF